MKKHILEQKQKLWYMICFMFLGLIDQRRGSAVGEIQMIFSNLTGIVVALLLLPSLELTKFREKIIHNMAAYLHSAYDDCMLATTVSLGI